MPTAPFDLEAVIESVLPLGAMTSIPEYPYFAAGTCFLMRHRRRLWLVTAKHALKDKQHGAPCVPWNLDTHDVFNGAFAVIHSGRRDDPRVAPQGRRSPAGT